MLSVFVDGQMRLIIDRTISMQVTKADMQPAKTEAMLRGTEENMDDSARGTSTLHRISVTDHRSPGPAGMGLNGPNAV